MIVYVYIYILSKYVGIHVYRHTRVSIYMCIDIHVYRYRIDIILHKYEISESLEIYATLFADVSCYGECIQKKRTTASFFF